MANYLLVNYNFFPFAAGGTEHYVLEQAKYLIRLGHDVVVMAPVEEDTAITLVNWYSDEYLKLYSYQFESQLVWGVCMKTPLRMDLYKKDSIDLKNSFQRFFIRISEEYPFDNLELHAFTACFGLHFIKAFKSVFTFGSVRYYHHIPINCPKHTLEKSGIECRVEVNLENCTRCIQRTYEDTFYLKWFESINPAYLSFLPASLNRKHLTEAYLESFNALIEAVREIIVFSRDMLTRIHSTSRVRMIRHGIKPEFLQPKPSSRDSKVLTFAYLGRIEKIKGILTLVKAWKSMPVQAFRKLRIAGDIENAPLGLKQSLLELAKRKDVDLVGYVKEGISSFLRSAHCLIVPSEWYETGPMVIHEAIACGANVIGSDIGGVNELCMHYHQTVFKAFDVKDLVQKIEEFRYDEKNEMIPVSYEAHFSQLFEYAARN